MKAKNENLPTNKIMCEFHINPFHFDIGLEKFKALLVRLEQENASLTSTISP